MNIKIIQPAGLGDILFCLKIGQTYVKMGHTVYWPVIPQYSWIKDYLVYEGIHWKEPEICHWYIDLQSGAKIFPNIPIMDAKYKMAGIDYSDWKNYLTFKRDAQKEKELYQTVVHSEPYCLICDSFASPPGMLKRDIPQKEKMSNIFITYSDRYTPFDWCKVIENAAELRLVDTCYTYLVEVLNTKAEKLFLYSRDGRFYTDHLWKKNWNYIK
jgi:hypothetical protein